MFKLVVADLDGTLMYKKKISKKTIETIKKLQDNGVHFSIATGRHPNACFEIYEELGIKGPIICNNGAMIIDPVKNKVIEQSVMSNDASELIVEVCKRMGSDFLLYTLDEIVGTKKSRDLLLETIGGKVPYDITVLELTEIPSRVHDNVVKILIIEEDETKRERLKSLLKKIGDISVVNSRVQFIDCGSKISNKGIALEKLANYYGLDMSEVIAFGDQENDLSMIQSAGFGVAMGNAISTLKVGADFITSDVRDDGFSFGVDMFVSVGDSDD